MMQVFEQSILILASPEQVDRCITEPELMKGWLNPLLRCQPVGSWSVLVGSRFRFSIRLPLLSPSLECVVSERRLGLVVWSFTGFFVGDDRWECRPQPGGTLLVNRFSFDIPNPWVAWGFRTFAQSFTQQDMQAQLRRLKSLAEQDPDGNVKLDEPQ